MPIVSEESSPMLPEGAESFLLVDPLDGTREFVARNGQFTINIALVHGERAIAGVVCAPALGELFLGSQTAGAWLSERGGALRPVHVSPSVAPAPLRVLGSRSHERPGTRDWLDALSRPWALQPLGSSIKFCRIAQGHADIYPRFGDTSQWDTAAGQAVLEAAGGAVRTAAGAPLAYGAGHALINPHFIAVADGSWQLPAFA
jgi:3'(2'), 5'-bisphosphate nucleotidase